MFRDLERVQTSFAGIAAHRDFGAAVAYAGTSEGGDAALVSISSFPVLELTPHLGRLLGPTMIGSPAADRSSSSVTTTGSGGLAHERM